MESLLVGSGDLAPLNPQYSPKASADALNLALLKSQKDDDSVEFQFDDLYKGLTITAAEVIEKLNELLKPQLPAGIESLNPTDYTPEKTAERIVNQVTGLFSVYQSQNPKLEGEELVQGFMETIRKGVGQGYDEAFSILDSLGAFEFDGVKAGIEETKELIEQKLDSFEKLLRKQLGLATAQPDEFASAPVKTELLAQGGAHTLSIAA